MIYLNKPVIEKNTITCHVAIDDTFKFKLENTLTIDDDPPLNVLSNRSEGFVSILIQYAILNEKHIHVSDCLDKTFVLNVNLIKTYYEKMFNRQFDFSIKHEGNSIETIRSNRTSLSPFSLGVNSCCTYLSLTSRCQLLLTGCYDLHSEDHLIRIKHIVDQENKRLVVYRTNIKDFFENSFFDNSFEKKLSKNLCLYKALSHVLTTYNLSRIVSNVYLSSWNKYDDATITTENDIILNVNKVFAELLSSNDVNVVYYGNYTRFEKIQKCIQLDPVFFLYNLQVCDNTSSIKYNCNKCNKCLTTTIAFLLLNISTESLPTFDFDITYVNDMISFITNNNKLDLYNEMNKRSICLFIQLFKDCIK